MKFRLQNFRLMVLLVFVQGFFITTSIAANEANKLHVDDLKPVVVIPKADITAKAMALPARLSTSNKNLPSKRTPLKEVVRLRRSFVSSLPVGTCSRSVRADQYKPANHPLLLRTKEGTSIWYVGLANVQPVFNIFEDMQANPTKYLAPRGSLIDK